jgi:hypothetical protein
MIRINLLPVREARRKAEVGSQLAMIALAAGVSVVLAIGVHSIVRAELSGAKKPLRRLGRVVRHTHGASPVNLAELHLRVDVSLFRGAAVERQRGRVVATAACSLGIAEVLGRPGNGGS